MPIQGNKVYDDEEFFKKYIEKRTKGNAPNEILEKPIINELIGRIEGKAILDLGCGSGLYGKELIEKGAKSYFGIDSSKKMIALARANLSGFDCKLENIALENLKLQKETYDLVLSRLVLHYMEYLEDIFEEIKGGLKGGGSFLFSVEHPIITSNYESYHQKKKIKRANWIVDNYFDSGKRVNKWMGEEVVKYHRTIEEYIQLVQEAGFVLDTIRESKPQRANFDNPEEYERRKRIPLFMIFKVKKRIAK